MMNDWHVDVEGDAPENCRMSESAQLCAQIGMMMMLMMQLTIAECQDLFICLQILTSRRRLKATVCQNMWNCPHKGA